MLSGPKLRGCIPSWGGQAIAREPPRCSSWQSPGAQSHYHQWDWLWRMRPQRTAGWTWIRPSWSESMSIFSCVRSCFYTSIADRAFRCLLHAPTTTTAKVDMAEVPWGGGGRSATTRRRRRIQSSPQIDMNHGQGQRVCPHPGRRQMCVHDILPSSRSLICRSWSFLALVMIAMATPLAVRLWHSVIRPLEKPAFAVVDIPGKGKGMIAHRDFLVSPLDRSPLWLLLT